MIACIKHVQPQAIVMELCEEGDLLNYIRRRAGYMIEVRTNNINVENELCSLQMRVFSIKMPPRELKQLTATR
jgi:hypothetical protein